MTTVPFCAGKLLVAICALCLWSAAFAPAQALCQDTQHVLVLNSYNSGLTWTDSEDAGIRSVLQTRVADLVVHSEFLDTKTVSDAEHYQRVFGLIKHKYASIPLSVVIATDDDAYNFYLEHHKALFPGVPVVFCGVNYFSDAQRQGREGLVTGVVEAFDIPSTLRTALRLHPQASRVIVINDRTTTGLANKKVITEQVIPQFSESVTFEFYEDLTMAELLEKVRAVPPDDIVLLMTFNTDRSGRTFSYDQSIALIAKESKAPIYGVWDFYLGKGIVGGMLTSGFDQGRIAAEMALRILDGEAVRTIPVVTVSPNRYKFDYRQMERFDIKTADLPPGSLVIDEPGSFYALHKALVWGTISGFLALTAIIVVLLLYIGQRRRAEVLLRDSEEKYRSLVDYINIGVCRTAPSGRYLQANPAMAKIFGYDTPELLMETPAAEVYWNPDDRERFFEKLQAKGSVRDVEMAMKTKDGALIWVSLSVTVQYDDQGHVKWADSALEDITERKEARDKLQEAHDELEARVRERTSELSSANEQLHGRSLEITALYETTKALSLHDSLTGLWNHEEILRILGLELARAAREGSHVSVIMADLDHFKQINDTYGHITGDVVLCAATDRMLSTFRSYDAIGRYGGDEFVVVMPGCDAQHSVDLAERLRKTIGDEPIVTAAGTLSATMSLGIAISGGKKRRDVGSLVHAADLALYRAKTNGRDRVELASSDE